MTYLALSLVLFAAVCHATWNFQVKRLHSGPELVWLFSFVSIFLYLPLAIAVVIRDAPAFGFRETVFYIGTTVLHVAYFLLLQRGYRDGDLSVVYPTARATGPLLSSAFAILVLGEQPTSQIIAGGLAIVVGIVMLTGGFNRRAEHLTRSLGYGLSVGTLIGSYTIWDAYAVSRLGMPPLLVEYVSSVFLAIVLLPYALTRREAVRRLWTEERWPVMAIAVFNPLAYILVLTAMVTTPVVYIAPAREVSVLITVVLGSVLLGEGVLRQRLGWAMLILAGMVLLATG